MHQIIYGVLELRKVNVIHRDLKLQNIILKDDTIKIADLGFAISCQESEFAKSQVGTMATMAPEIIENKLYNSLVDAYSVGVIYY